MPVLVVVVVFLSIWPFPFAFPLRNALFTNWDTVVPAHCSCSQRPSTHTHTHLISRCCSALAKRAPATGCNRSAVSNRKKTYVKYNRVRRLVGSIVGVESFVCGSLSAGAINRPNNFIRTVNRLLFLCQIFNFHIGRHS